MKDKSFFNSLRFKTWTYFVLFSLSIFLLFMVFQLIMIEPFYKNTVTREMRDLSNSIASVYFSDATDNEKREGFYSYVSQKDSCVVIYNTDTDKYLMYDTIGENGCVIYDGEGLNKEYFEDFNQKNEESVVYEEQLSIPNNLHVLIYGQKYLYKDTNYMILANTTLQSLNVITKTIRSQLFFLFLFVLLLSVLLSVLFSSFISKPIIAIKKEAKKLQSGNYDLHFEHAEINEVEDLAETIELAAKEVSKIDETKNELLANVSHDIKTPLTMIKAYAEMIKDISGDDKVKRNEHLDIINSEVDSLNNLVSDMLDLSKLSNGAIDLVIQPFDLSGTIERTVRKFQTLAKNENVQLICNSEPELIVYGDEIRITEVIYNFISNALKHYGKDKKVIINAYLESKGKVRVEVQDHGSGIDENVLPYIWDRYYKNDKKYFRSQNGTGLGLAICKAILELHKADYGVESSIGKGSTFYFILNALNIE